MELELRHLKVVSTIASAGSVTKAAAELGIAQSALTAQLGRIERTLGGPLFDRDHRGVRPTPLGELVITRAQLLLPAMSGLLDEATRFNDDNREQRVVPDRLSIGSSTSALLAPLIQRLGRHHPDMTVSTTASWSADEIGDMLVDGRIDSAVVGLCAGSGPPGTPDVEWRTYAIDPVFVLLPQHHPLADRDEVALADFSEVDWAATPGDGCFRECFAAACAREGFTPSSLYVADAASCMELVASGTAVALCQAVRVLPGFVTVPIADVPLTWRHMVGWRRDSAAADFGDALMRRVGESHQELIVAAPSIRPGCSETRRSAFNLPTAPPDHHPGGMTHSVWRQAAGRQLRSTQPLGGAARAHRPWNRRGERSATIDLSSCMTKENHSGISQANSGRVPGRDGCTGLVGRTTGRVRGTVGRTALIGPVDDVRDATRPRPQCGSGVSATGP